MRSAASRSSTAASSALVAIRSEPAAASSDTTHGPVGSHRERLAHRVHRLGGPSERTVTSPPCASLSRSASSTAFTSVGLRALSPDRSSRNVVGSSRLCADASGTTFAQTAIFIAGDSNDGAPPTRD